MGRNAGFPSKKGRKSGIFMGLDQNSEGISVEIQDSVPFQFGKSAGNRGAIRPEIRREGFPVKGDCELFCVRRFRASRKVGQKLFPQGMLGQNLNPGVHVERSGSEERRKLLSERVRQRIVRGKKEALAGKPEDQRVFLCQNVDGRVFHGKEVQGFPERSPR